MYIYTYSNDLNCSTPFPKRFEPSAYTPAINSRPDDRIADARGGRVLCFGAVTRNECLSQLKSDEFHAGGTGGRECAGK